MVKLMPEHDYSFNLLTREEITEGSAITGFVEKILPDKKIVRVRLGIGLVADMPFSETTIYPLRYSTKRESAIPSNIWCLLKKRIRVKVIKITPDEIFVSRKQNMQDAFEKLQNITSTKMYITEVIPKTAFGDIGDGIVGKILINNVCRCHIQSVRDYLHRGQSIDVVIMSTDAEQRFNVSYKDACKPYNPDDYKVGMTIVGKIGNWIKVTKVSEYYVNISPQVSGILNINKHMHLDYGTDVECLITGVGDKGLFLELVRVF